MQYEIRLCKEEEYELLHDFLKNHWRENHIFVRNKKLLLWQHLNAKDNVINFAVAYNFETKVFDAILGFIPMTQFDQEANEKDIWLAIWKVKESYASTGIGLQLLMYLSNRYKAKNIGVIGASEDALKVYKAFRYKTGIMNQFYIKNEMIDEQNVATFSSSIKRTKNNSEYNIRAICFSELNRMDVNYCYEPFKSKHYFENRYANVNFYEYEFYAIEKEHSVKAVFVARRMNIKGVLVIRIVDWIGEFPKNCSDAFLAFLADEKAYFIDLVCIVPNKEDILDMGFIEKDPNKEVVPHYYEPFLKENIQIKYAYKSKSKDFAIFKADSDQDRPNM